MPSHNTHRLTWVSLTLDLGYLFMAAPAKHSRCSFPWMRGISSWLPLLTLNMELLLSALLCLRSHSSLDIVQETGIKTIPMEKKYKKAKWLSGEALQIAVKRREVKSKGEKERCTYLNVDFQRIARRDKKAFLSDQCKEREENNRMGKTRDLFKKIRDIREYCMQSWTQ